MISVEDKVKRMDECSLKTLMYDAMLDAIGTFDFKEAANVFKVMNWGWAPLVSEDNEFGVPCAQDIYDQVSEDGRDMIVCLLEDRLKYPRIGPIIRDSGRIKTEFVFEFINKENDDSNKVEELVCTFIITMVAVCSN